MKIKSLISITCCLFYLGQATAQKRNIYFFKNSGKEVELRDSADYMRVVSEPDSGSTLYNVKEYYLNNKPKLIGKSSRFDMLNREDQFITYYPTGKKHEVATYIKGAKVGDAYEYYPNGKLYTYKKYALVNEKSDQPILTKVLLMMCNDSTGKTLVTDGNGYYIGYDANFKYIEEEGTVKEGLRDGKWKGQYEHEKAMMRFTEEYNNGKLISGEGIDENNKTYNYTISKREPDFPGGMGGFYRYIHKNFYYPANKAQGTVLLSFMIETDGSLTKFNIINNPDDELSKETLRVLKRSPKWLPGIYYGKVMATKFTVPVAFTIPGL